MQGRKRLPTSYEAKLPSRFPEAFFLGRPSSYKWVPRGWGGSFAKATRSELPTLEKLNCCRGVAAGSGGKAEGTWRRIESIKGDMWSSGRCGMDIKTIGRYHPGRWKVSVVRAFIHECFTVEKNAGVAPKFSTLLGLAVAGTGSLGENEKQSGERNQKYFFKSLCGQTGKQKEATYFQPQSLNLKYFGMMVLTHSCRHNSMWRFRQIHIFAYNFPQIFT